MVSLQNRLESKVVVVTGGSSGIGLAVAERIAAGGATVVIGARREAEGEQAAAQIEATGRRAIFVRTDVMVEEDVARLIQTAVDRFGRLDGAFNNAGGVGAFGQIAELTDDAWQHDLAINLTSVFHCLRHQIPAIRRAGGGSIVNNASILGVAGVGGMAAYTAAKHGVVGLLSDECPFLTGAALAVDGGFTAQ